MTEMQTGESAKLLAELARPFVGDCPSLDLQKSVIAALEAGIKKNGAKFDKHVLFVGGLELPVIPAASEEMALLDNVKLVELPSITQAAKMAAGTVSHALATNLNGFALTAGIEAQLVRHTLLTMMAAHQLEYLRESRFAGHGWKVVVEIHYYRKRQNVGRDMLHKDTFGQTLFVNLNYDTDVEIPGPEYILNPAVVEEHETQIKQSLPPEFLDDLRWVRGRLGKPTEIGIASIKPHQFVAFVDEAIHHMSPQLGGRTVTAKELTAFLVKAYGQDVVQDARAAHTAFHKESGGFGGFIRSLAKDTKPFSAYLKVIPAADANLWAGLIDLIDRPGAEINRLALLDAGLGDDVIDRLLDENWEGYQNVAIPKAAKVAVTDGPLKRQASTDALKKQVPAPATGDRRFFRTWVRIVKA